MYDSVGSIAFPNRLLDTMRENGVEVRTYDLLNSPWLSNKANWRNHRKIVVIDGEIAHTGGMNIGNEYSGRGKSFLIGEIRMFESKGLLYSSCRNVSFMIGYFSMKGQKRLLILSISKICIFHYKRNNQKVQKSYRLFTEGRMIKRGSSKTLSMT